EVFIQISEAGTGRAVRTNRWKYSVRRAGADEFTEETAGSDVYEDEYLYDLEADPNEFVNLIGQPSFAKVVADLRTRLVRRMRAAGETEPEFIDARAVPLHPRA